MHGHTFRGLTEARAAAWFGPRFSAELAAAPVGAWAGPISSPFGLHLVRVDARKEAAPLALPAVRGAVRNDVVEARRADAKAAVERAIVEQFTVRVERAR